MKREPQEEPGADLTDAELDVYAEFSDEVLAGRNPSVDEFMQRVPGAGPMLRKLMEADLWLYDQIAKLRAKHPGVDLARLLDPDWRHRRGRAKRCR